MIYRSRLLGLWRWERAGANRGAAAVAPCTVAIAGRVAPASVDVFSRSSLRDAPERPLPARPTTRAAGACGDPAVVRVPSEFPQRADKRRHVVGQRFGVAGAIRLSGH